MPIKKQRTTLTLLLDPLAKAKRIARARGVNLSAVISDALSEGLRVHAAAQRSEEVLSAYRKAFSGFTKVERRFLTALFLNYPEALIRDRSRVWAIPIRYQRRERTRGYSSVWQRSAGEKRHMVESARIAYLSALGPV